MDSFTTTSSPSSEEKYSIPIISLSAVNVSSFVPFKLWGNKQSNNYSSWKQQMLCLIKSLDLLCFIYDSPESAAITDDDKYSAFGKADMLLKGWILGTLSEGVLDTVANRATAKDVWLQLEKNFTVSAGQPLNITTDTVGQKDLNKYLPLYKAIQQGNWEAAKEILDKDPHASKARINSSKQTALHVAVATGKPDDFVKNFWGLMMDDELALKDDDGNTTLSIAAAVGNIKAATTLAERMPNLLYISNNIDNFPVQQAALFANRDMLRELIFLTKDDLEINPYAGVDGLRLLIYTINAKFFDAALHLVEKYPHLAKLKLLDGTSALKRMATMSLLRNYKSSKSNMSKRSNFSRTPVETTLQPQSRMSNNDDIERTAPDAKQEVSNINAIPIRTEESVRELKRIKYQQLLIGEAIQLIDCLCKILASMSHKEAAEIYVDAIMRATELGSYVVVKQIVEAFPDATCCSTPSSEQSILHIAVQNRSADVFNLLYQKRSSQNIRLDSHKYEGVQSNRCLKYFHLDTIDSEGNNLLHAAANLAPSHKLNEVSGAALQMQYEIQWYKKVENIVHPNCRDQPNQSGKTPKMVFEEKHKELKKEAETWTKYTANSCMVAAALIAGVAFAGVITVPNGDDEKCFIVLNGNVTKCGSPEKCFIVPNGNVTKCGSPGSSEDAAFVVYMASNVCSLWMAIISLLVLLFMSLSRYADEDFLLSLPGKLQISLAALFSAVAFMIISSYAALVVMYKSKGGLSNAGFAVTLSVFCAPIIVLFLFRHLGPLRPYFRFTTGYGKRLAPHCP